MNVQPVEPGWYFAKFKSKIESTMECVQVLKYLTGRIIVYRVAHPHYYLPEQFYWFGKVPMPVEIK